MTKDNPFVEKRSDLEMFLSEQIIGPGAFNKRFFFLKDWEGNEFNGHSLSDRRALENASEVIGELPAYQYSSAILFPISITADERSKAEDNNEEENVPEGPEIAQSPKADDEEFRDDQLESTSSKNQNYPNTCGLSFALRADGSPENDLNVRISFRKYQKIKQRECSERKLGIWIDQYKDEVRDAVTTYFTGIFTIEEKDNNTFVLLAEGININEHLYALDYVNLDRFAKAHLLPLIIDLFPDKQLFKETTRSYDNVEYIFTTIYEDALIEELQAMIRDEQYGFKTCSELVKWLEIYNKLKLFSNELKSIYRKSSSKNFPTPIWESISYDLSVKLPALPNNKTVFRGELPIEGFKELGLSYQYLKDKGAIFIKLILVNRSRIELKVDEPPQLNKKDLANELSFFGVRITISERSRDCFVPYNPPNLLLIDEEDNFNKLLYRNFKDYAEGYNTSVNWSVTADEVPLRHVRTEFIPEQETPSVDYRPSKVVGNDVKGLIDEKVLSIRELSTLSEQTDVEVLRRLTEMVTAYEHWIKDKRSELDQDSLVNEGRTLLEKQLNACLHDLKRLKRNIELLRSDAIGMAAFRVMNTAMFMQLHHSISIKEQKKVQGKPFVPENNVGFYKDLVLKDEYTWRSFQLAFVLLNIDAFIRPPAHDRTVDDIFGTGWPERNELADLVWFPTGGGKTEAYLGIIAFAISYRRFTKGDKVGGGTAVLMRYTLRLLTLQQFQRATLLICALEVIRKDNYPLPERNSLGEDRITIGLFVGRGSLPNKWDQMKEELDKIIEQLKDKVKGGAGPKVKTNLPHTECPWCGGGLFVDSTLPNVDPKKKDAYLSKTKLTIMCNTEGCSFYGRIPNEKKGLPLRLFDEDIYKYPPTLLFGTVDKFAALANKVSTVSGDKNEDSRRLLGRGAGQECHPPELIIQDELHLLLGPLGSAVGLFEKSIDELCSYDVNGTQIRPKIITSTATTRNTDKQIFALFDRRCEIFPKQGITCDDAFFSFYKRDTENVTNFSSNRRYLGLLPVGKTQVWMQLRIAAICLAHRVRFLIERFDNDAILSRSKEYEQYEKVLDYYHTVLSYFNSLKEVGKTQSQLSHYLPGDLNLVLKNTTSWTFISKMIKSGSEIESSELTGRLSGEEVKTNLASIESTWGVLKGSVPPEFVIATNMISVGIDVSRFNTMIINSMPRNTAEYIQASSRVARDKEGLVITVHHPFRSRDISHYQRFKEFHEKFYSYVEPISITPFADKALDRYFAMYLAVMIRHTSDLGLSNNNAASAIDQRGVDLIRDKILGYIKEIRVHADKLNEYLMERETGVRSNVDGIIGDEEIADIKFQLDDLLIDRWLERVNGQDPVIDLRFRTDSSRTSLFKPRNSGATENNWNVKESLREIAPSIVIKTVQQ